MLKIKIEIAGESGDEQTLTSATSTNAGNNISQTVNNVFKTRKQSSNPFLLGYSKLNENAVLSEKKTDNDGNIDYYIGKQLSNSNSEFTNSYVITVSGTDITMLFFSFDTKKMLYPTEINIDGTIYENSDPIFGINTLTSANSHTITISKWSEPNAPFILTGIYDNLNISLDTTITSYQYNVRSIANIAEPSFGLVSGSGTLEFIDSNGEFYDYATMGLLVDNQKVTAKLTNTLTNKTTTEYSITDKWNYNVADKYVTVSLKDDLVEMQDILIDKIPMLRETKTLQYLYDYLKSKTPSKFVIPTYSSLDSSIQQRISGAKFSNFYMDTCNLWEAWNKLCNIAQIHMYLQPNNTIGFYGD